MSAWEDFAFGHSHRPRPKRFRGIATVLLHGIEHRSCSVCASLKPLDDYTSNHSACKACHNERARASYARKRAA